MAPFRHLARVASALPVVNDTGFDWYVDSVNGNDANTGKSRSQAFQTIAALEAVMSAGESVGLARGSSWREQFDLPGNACQVAAYGSGARPILDASDVDAAGSWSKTAGRTNVYQASITPAWNVNGNNWLNVFENGAFLTRAADLATCDSTPGSCYPSAASGTITLYIHATDSSDPGTNGKVYEHSQRQYGLTCYSYSGCRITGIHTTQQLYNDGSLVAGPSSILVDCLASYGHKHNMLYRTGSTLIGCICQEAYYGATSLAMFTGNDNTPANEGLTLINCQAINASLNSKATGFYCHRNTSGDFGAVLYQGCTAEYCNIAFDGLHADSIAVSDSVITGCTYCFRINDASPWTINGATITGSTSRVIEFITAGTVVASGLDVDIACNNSLPFYATVAANLTLTDSNIRGVSFANANRIFYISHASAVVSASGNTYGNGFNHVYYCPSISSLTSDGNCFDDGSESFNLNGATYATVALWQAGSSQDAASTIGGCVS